MIYGPEEQQAAYEAYYTYYYQYYVQYYIEQQQQQHEPQEQQQQRETPVGDDCTVVVASDTLALPVGAAIAPTAAPARIRVRVLYSNPALAEGDLAISAGQVLVVLAREEDWW